MSTETLPLRVTVDQARCEGHGQCLVFCPEVFRFDGTEGRAVATSEDIVDPAIAAKARRAAVGCPEQAIGLTAVRRP